MGLSDKDREREKYYLNLELDLFKLSKEERLEYVDYCVKLGGLDHKKRALMFLALASTFLGSALTTTVLYGNELTRKVSEISDFIAANADKIANFTTSMEIVAFAYGCFGVGVISAVGTMVADHQYRVEASRLSKYNKGLLIKHGNSILTKKHNFIKDAE